MKKLIKILVFGTFDGLHPGHEYFLQKARYLGTYITVVLPPDEIVKKLKGKAPKNQIRDRIKAIKNLPNINEVRIGDTELGTYTVIKQVKPHIIALGYDQEELKADLKTWLKKNNLDIKLVTINPIEPTKYKSSLL